MHSSTREKMKANSLFTKEELQQPELSADDKKNIIDKLIARANWGVQFLYGVYETASMLRLTIDEMQGLIYSYKLDCTRIRTSLRIPWWSICEYLIDPAEDIDKAFEEYLRTIPKKNLQSA